MIGKRKRQLLSITEREFSLLITALDHMAFNVSESIHDMTRDAESDPELQANYRAIYADTVALSDKLTTIHYRLGKGGNYE